MLSLKKFIKQTDFLFIGVRLSSIFSRTILLLFVIFVMGSDSQSIQLAFLFTIGLSIFQILSIDLHQNFYKYFFNNSSKHITLCREYLKYIHFYFAISFLLYPVFFVLIYLIFDSFFIAVLFSFNIFVELIYNEYQRFIIVKKNFHHWCFIASLLYIIPALSSIIVYYLIATDIVKIFLLTSFVANIILFQIIIKNSKVIRIIKYLKIINIKYFFIKNIKVYFYRIKYTITNFAQGHVIIITRYIIYIFDNTLFAIYVSMISISGVITILLDLFYLVFKRKNFINNYSQYMLTFRDFKMLLIVFAGFMIVFTSCLIVLYLKFKISIFIVFYSIGVSLIGVGSALSTITYESVYWHKKLIDRVIIELFYYSAIVLISIYFIITDLSSSLLLIYLIVFSIFLRLSVMTKILQK